MSSISNIIAFDFTKFEDIVIPSLKEGEGNDLVKNEIERNNYSSAKFENLNKIISLFNSDLTECNFGKLFAANIYGIYKTTRVFEKPETDCWTYEDLAILLERMILRHCAKYYLTIGKIYRLDLVLTSSNTLVKEKLNKLCNNSNFWAHCSADSDGIYGWIDSNEVNFIHSNENTIITSENSIRPQENKFIVDAFKGIIKVASSKKLGLLFGNSLNFETKGNNKLYQINELIKTNESVICEPYFNLKMIKDYR